MEHERLEQSASDSREMQDFQEKKRKFFIRTGLTVRDALKMHQDQGLWEKNEKGESWENVSEHCLVEVARVEVLADELKLPKTIKNDLISAAALHDFFKRQEVEFYKSQGMSWENYEKVEAKADDVLRSKGFKGRIIKLVGSVGVIGALEAKKVLEKKKQSKTDLAFLIMHYVDSYTHGSNWVTPAETLGEKKINDVDRRQGNAGERYKPIIESGKSKFGGENPMEAEIKVCHMIEKKFADMINAKNENVLLPEDLPEFVDNKIRDRIENIE